VGDAYRVDVQDPDGSGYTSTYMYEADGARYTMDCSADDRDAHDWMDLAETIELQPPGRGARRRRQPRRDRRRACRR
jgi:hypothetical protein